MIALTDWSVSIDTTVFIDADRVAQVCEALSRTLGEGDAAIAGSSTQLGVTMTVTTVAGAGQAAVEALDMWHAALRDLQLHSDGESAVEVVSADEQDRRLSESPMPEIWSTPEVATYLGVSRQRVHQLLADNPRFPAPLQRLGSGPIWLADSVRAFDAGWTRKPGRPPVAPVSVDANGLIGAPIVQKPDPAARAAAKTAKSAREARQAAKTARATRRAARAARTTNRAGDSTAERG
jgi:predicted DNA-binding transcriptional regulator AlpA